jgi:hypothetical protein
MAGGLVNDGQVIAYTATTAITYPGTLIKGTSTANTADTCGAGEEPFGFAFTSTKHPVTGTAQAGVKVGVHALIPGQVIEVPLLATNAQIAIGDKVETAAGGTVDLKSGAGWIVGEALAAAATNAGGTAATMYLKIRVNKYYASS